MIGKGGVTGDLIVVAQVPGREKEKEFLIRSKQNTMTGIEIRIGGQGPDRHSENTDADLIINQKLG